MAEYDFTKAKNGDIFYATIDKAVGVVNSFYKI